MQFVGEGATQAAPAFSRPAGLQRQVRPAWPQHTAAATPLAGCPAHPRVLLQNRQRLLSRRDARAAAAAAARRLGHGRPAAAAATARCRAAASRHPCRQQRAAAAASGRQRRRIGAAVEARRRARRRRAAAARGPGRPALVPGIRQDFVLPATRAILPMVVGALRAGKRCDGGAAAAGSRRQERGEASQPERSLPSSRRL